MSYKLKIGRISIKDYSRGESRNIQNWHEIKEVFEEYLAKSKFEKDFKKLCDYNFDMEIGDITTLH